MTDLSSLIPEDTFTLKVIDPRTKNKKDKKFVLKGSGEPMTITIYGPYSDKFREVAHTQAKKKFALLKNNDAEDFTADDYLRMDLETLSKLIHSWDVEDKGKNLPFSEEEAFSLLKKLPWLVDQISEEQDKTTNFFKN